MLLSSIILILVGSGCFHFKPEIEDKTVEAVPVIKKVSTDQTAEGIEQLQVYILYPISSSYKIEIDANLDFNPASMEFMDLNSNPALILWENDSIIAVNQIPENMDGKIKINQIIKSEYSDESRKEVIIKFFVGLSDSDLLDNNVLRKEGWVKLGWNKTRNQISILSSELK